MNLFLALVEEHKGRTGHDIYKHDAFNTTKVDCKVCMFLHAEKRDQERAEREFYEEQNRISVGDVPF